MLQANYGCRLFLGGGNLSHFGFWAIIIKPSSKQKNWQYYCGVSNNSERMVLGRSKRKFRNISVNCVYAQILCANDQEKDRPHAKFQLLIAISNNNIIISISNNNIGVNSSNIVHHPS